MTQKTSNEKRLAALHNKKVAQSSQRELVRNALSDKAVNKVIRFSDSDDDDPNNQKITDILHDVEESDSVSFDMKPQFFGKKGEKLMSMQSKIGSDDRFQLDERFESDSDTHNSSDSDDSETKELNSERQSLYSTMDSVLGNLGITAPKHNPAAESQHVVDQFVRFDPTDASHEKFLIPKCPQNVEKPSYAEKTVQDTSDDVIEEKNVDDDRPIVDNSAFFEVKTDFNKAIADTNGFSFKFDFAIENSHTDTQETNDLKAEECSIKQLQVDSSDEEAIMDSESFDNKLVNEGPKSNYFFYSINPIFKQGPISQFRKTKTTEEIEKDWTDTRYQITAEYKKRHKDAVRFQKKFVSKT